MLNVYLDEKVGRRPFTLRLTSGKHKFYASFSLAREDHDEDPRRCG